MQIAMSRIQAQTMVKNGEILGIHVNLLNLIGIMMNAYIYFNRMIFPVILSF